MPFSWLFCNSGLRIGAVLGLAVLLGAGCKEPSKPARASDAASDAVGQKAVSVGRQERKTNDAPSAIKWSGEWTTLFDGKTLTGWKATDFAGAGEVTVGGGEIRIGMGAELSGINWTNGPLPTTDYEIALEAMRVDGSDFFCGLTVPVSNSCCTLIVGGWGGSLVGISSIDNLDASENETMKTHYFEAKRWYMIRMRVTADKIESWIDGEKIVDVEIKGRKVSMRLGDIERAAPMGYSTWVTSAAVRNIRLRLIDK